MLDWAVKHSFEVENTIILSSNAIFLRMSFLQFYLAQKFLLNRAKVTMVTYNINATHSLQGCTLMLMGSADKLPEKPKDQVRFVEDMSESEAAAVSYHNNHQRILIT